MKTIIIVILVCFFLVLSAENIRINSNPFAVNVLSSSENETVIEYTIGSFERETVLVNGETYYDITLAKEASSFQKGAPALPFVTRSLIIPDAGLMSVSVLESEYVEYSMPVLPSKGILSRQIDPKDVPYEFSEVYGQNTFYPEATADLGEPYIMRDFRGITVKAQPFTYNPQTQILRVYTHLVLEVSNIGIDTRNVKVRGERRDNVYFREIYSNHFLNYETMRYDTVEEQGRMIVICHDDFTDVIAPFVTWKNQKGLVCDLYTTSTVGTNYTVIKSFIQTQYDLGDGLTFVQLVGDHAQIPAYGGNKDPSYSLLEGGDSYPDLFIGRFSGTVDAHIETQVERTLHYERDISSGAWLHDGFGIASDDGTGNGDDSEYDWEHLRNIRTHLLDYTYQNIDEFYEGSQGGGDAGGNPSDNMVTTAVNAGRGIGNYCGHGSTTSWVTTGYNTSDVNNLTNDFELPFIISVACVNGNFMNYTCFAEAWLRATNNSTGDPTGAIAFYGSSINQSWDPPMRGQDHINDLLVGWNYTTDTAIDQKFSFGGLCFNGSCNMIDRYGSGGADMFETWHIFGDASVMVRTDEPSAISVSHDPNILTGQSTFSVSTGVDNALICLYDGSDIIGVGYANGSGDATLSLDPIPLVPQDLTLTVTANNRTTHIGVVPVISGAGPNVIIDNYVVSSGGDDIIEPDETAFLSVTLNNTGTEAASNVGMTISETDTYISLIDATQSFGTIPSSGSSTENDAFSFAVASNIPDSHPFTLECAINSDESSWYYDINLIAAGPVLSIESYTVYSDRDDIIGPGETASISVTIQNTGGAAANNVGMILSESDGYITLTDATQSFGNIPAGGTVTENDAYIFNVASDIPDEHQIDLDCLINSDENSWSSQMNFIASHPAIITFDPAEFVENLGPSETSSQNLNIGNSGGATLDYSISINETTRGKENDQPGSVIRNYCTASGGCDEYISRVQVGDIDNSTGCSGYADHTALATNMAKLSSYDITVSIANPYNSSERGGLWIDWNQDEDFEDSGETITTAWIGYGPYTATITPPEFAVAGETRMRVRLTWNVTPTSCGDHSYGEVEDYTINILNTGPEWLLINGTLFVDDSIPMGAVDDVVVVGFNSTDLTAGIYTAELNLSSNDPNDPLIILPVTLNIESPPEAPVNVQCVMTDTNMILSWDPVTGANSYKIYSSSSPHGHFDLLEIVPSSFNTRSYPVVETKMFYMIIASTESITE